MTATADILDHERDSLYILPLVTVPIATSALQHARLIKNSHLESVVELFQDDVSGSGQIRPEDLNRVFQFDSENGNDEAIVRSLCKLHSYDVYSLRLELRKLGIVVDEHTHLQISERKKAELAEYMHAFTKPLVAAVYGDCKQSVADPTELINMFLSPDQDKARENLEGLARDLGIGVQDIPAFLEDYGDVYLSLAYYQHCLDSYVEKLQDFLVWLQTTCAARDARADTEFLKTSAYLERRLHRIMSDVQNILDMFTKRTVDMWNDVSADKFHEMKDFVLDYQIKIGAALCAVTVKLDAWSTQFPNKSAGGVARRIEFVMREMRYGMDGIEDIAQAEMVT